jgi:ankyrin repeat protein
MKNNSLTTESFHCIIAAARFGDLDLFTQKFTEEVIRNTRYYCHYEELYKQTFIGGNIEITSKVLDKIVLPKYDDVFNVLCKSGNVDLLRFVLTNKNGRWKTVVENLLPIMCTKSLPTACELGNLEMVMLLHNVGSGKILNSSFVNAIQHNRMDVLNYLIDCSPTTLTIEHLVEAAKHGRLEIFLSLLDDTKLAEIVSTDLNKNELVFQEACGSGNTDLVYILLNDNRFCPTSESVAYAASLNRIGVVNLLLQHKEIESELHFGQEVQFTSNNYPKLMGYLCKFGHYEFVKKLLKYRLCNPFEEESSLSYAVIGNSLDIIKLLLSDPRCTKNDCQFVFSAAIVELKPDIVKYLLQDSRVDPNAALSNYKPQKHVSQYINAFEFACSLGNIPIVSLLMNHRSVVIKDPVNSVKIASQGGHYDVLDMLLRGDKFMAKNEREKGVFAAIIYSCCRTENVKIIELFLLRARYIFTDTLCKQVVATACNFRDGTLLKIVLEECIMEPYINEECLRQAILDKNVSIYTQLLKDPKINPLGTKVKIPEFRNQLKSGKTVRDILGM